MKEPKAASLTSTPHDFTIVHKVQLELLFAYERQYRLPPKSSGLVMRSKLAAKRAMPATWAAKIAEKEKSR